MQELQDPQTLGYCVATGASETQQIIYNQYLNTKRDDY